MRTTTSAASGLRASAPAKTNPINRLETITLSSFLKHQRSAAVATRKWDHPHSYPSVDSARVWPQQITNTAQADWPGNRQSLD
jgi:hypothetical protein